MQGILACNRVGIALNCKSVLNKWRTEVTQRIWVKHTKTRLALRHRYTITATTWSQQYSSQHRPIDLTTPSQRSSSRRARILRQKSQLAWETRSHRSTTPERRLLNGVSLLSLLESRVRDRLSGSARLG